MTQIDAPQTRHPNQLLAEELRRTRLAGGLRHFIGGQWVDSQGGATFEAHSPIDNSLLTTVARGDEADIDRAARAAHDAFQLWKEVGGAERRRLLHKIADLIEARAGEIAVLESLDTGQAIRFMKSAATRGAENFRFYADRAPGAGDGQSLPAPGFLNYTLRQPIGPVGVITPWNTPFMLSTWKIAPALAAGCTVVHKPAEWSPVSATLLAEIMDEAGLPAGVHNLVHGLGESAGKALTEHPLIQAIAFVGETTTGSAIMRQGAQTLKRVHFELGGKNPVVVFGDADLDRALDAVVFMIYSLNGERCTSSSRVLVQEGIYDEFTARIAERARNIRVGDPLDPETEIGPLVHPRHLEKVMSYFGAAREEGATIAAGGERVGESGNYVSPTLFTGARNDMRIAQEEIFGPVLTAIPFSDEAEALSLANDVQYGLAAYLWTNDLTRAHRFAHGLQAGMIWVNSENVRHLPTPFGGVKNSGIGRDGGDYSFDFYMETKNVAISLGTHKAARLGVGTPPVVTPREAGE
ncbi:5-carboxymethyl-2-hydroxymuconate semialdehyde dehydrogenase [Deinococcus koreensis]|uniref:5-carboxymethyl-2-hydroxymuconate semialdehyde dehydrogenase n=1 Tax=Deinococcus koreensis TaxID=2054903 RepID=A0A2K3USV8_9DEIO|nr:5-carboxymethyl-2-hydroxymuconate semialdehyde dehydrogenase [Deinococcus koreensis]PNY79607.1 5-carboxymethyl-2-hydroxymuconate semialdehyde dehydrogenase [Deinococcus koreensis]